MAHGTLSNWLEAKGISLVMDAEMSSRSRSVYLSLRARETRITDKRLLAFYRPGCECHFVFTSM